MSFLVTGWSHERPVLVGADVVAPGVDLDGRDDRIERETCTGALDFVSPTGGHGVDNQYSAALVSWLDAGLGDMSDAVDASDDRGWIIDVTGIDDLRDDVLVAIYAADGETRGELLVERTGQLRGEWLEVELGEVPLPLGDEIGMRQVEHMRLRLRLFPEGELRDEITGELGASVPIETVLEVARVFEPALDLISAERMAMPDLDWDGDGTCEAASLGVAFRAVRLL